MTKQLRLFVALLALVIATGACSGETPTSPTVTVCTDQAARNAGGTLPCIYPITAKIDIIDVEKPENGGTARYGYGSDVKIRIQWEYDPYTPGIVASRAYLSADCREPMTNTNSGIIGDPSGQWGANPSPPSKFRGFTQSNCFIARVERIEASSTGWKTLEVLAEKILPWVIYFRDP